MKRALQALLISPDPRSRAKIVDGKITASIRPDARDYTRGPAALFCHLEPWAVMVDIMDVRVGVLNDVTKEEFQACGYPSFEHMFAGLGQYYPQLERTEVVTVIRWANVRGKFVDDPESHEQHLRHLRGQQKFGRCEKVRELATGKIGIVIDQLPDSTVVLNYDGEPMCEVDPSDLEPCSSTQ